MKKVQISILVFSLLLLCSCEQADLPSETNISSKPISNQSATTDTSSQQKVESPKGPLDKEASHALLLDVMNNKQQFIDESGAKTLFSDYKIPDVLDDVKIEPTKYSFVDFDNDGTDELAVEASTDFGLYVILHRYTSSNDIYGYHLGVRSFQEVKTDGTFSQSSSADTTYISKMSFDKTNLKIQEIASSDDFKKEYKIDGKPVTKEEIEKYFDDWRNIPKIIWLNADK